MVYLADSAAMLTRREASTPRLRLGVLASLLVNIALKLHSVPLPPTPLQCWLGGRQVHLGYASVYLPPSSSTLRWSCTRRKASTPRLRLGVLAFLLMQLQLKYASSKFKYTSATPRCTWTWTQRTWEESVVGTSCNFSSSMPRPSSSTPRLRLGVLELGLSALERSRPSTPPPAVVLIPKYHQTKEWICYNASHMWMQPEYRCYEWVAAACSQCTQRQIIKVLNSPWLFHRGREIKSIFTKQILFVCHRTQVSGSQSQFLKRIATILFLPKPKVRGIRTSLCIYSFFHQSIRMQHF